MVPRNVMALAQAPGKAVQREYGPARASAYLQGLLLADSRAGSSGVWFVFQAENKPGVIGFAPRSSAGISYPGFLRTLTGQDKDGWTSCSSHLQGTKIRPLSPHGGSSRCSNSVRPLSLHGDALCPDSRCPEELEPRVTLGFHLSSTSDPSN